jgi:hypothetical protein
VDESNRSGMSTWVVMLFFLGVRVVVNDGDGMGHGAAIEAVGYVGPLFLPARPFPF